jgi:predicted dinucleotide-binding enzyme
MKIGIIGSGMIGATVGKLWADAGHDVFFASRHPEGLKALVDSIGARAQAGTAAEAAKFGEVVMVSIPVASMADLARETGASLRGKIVLDTGNYYEKRDAAAAGDAAKHTGGSAQWAAAKFPGVRWVKAFNTVYFKTLETEAHRKGDQVGIPLASDDRGALDIAAQLVRDAGFDPVIVGPLARGKEFEPGSKVYNTGMSGREVRTHLGGLPPN